jgi:hypothetical protein
MAGAGSRKVRTPVTRSFRLKSNALAWAREQELEADQGRPQVHKTLKGITVADIVIRYRGADRDVRFVPIADTRPSYRQDRGAVRQPTTVASMVLVLPTFRHAPSDHRQGYGIM